MPNGDYHHVVDSTPSSTPNKGLYGLAGLALIPLAALFFFLHRKHSGKQEALGVSGNAPADAATDSPAQHFDISYELHVIMYQCLLAYKSIKTASTMGGFRFVNGTERH